MTEPFKITYSERQHEANEAAEPYLLYGGAKGGGKSWWLCCWAFEEAVSNPGNHGFLGRKRGVDFNNTTLETWRKVIPSNLWKVNEQKKRIFIPAFESFIDYGGMDREEDLNKFNSAEYGFIGIDQAEEISRNDFGMLRGTLRHKLPGGEEPSFKIRLTSNPAQCWLKDDFILRPKPGHRFIKALPSDNPFLATGYIQNLKEAFEHRPELLQAYLYGSWDELEGADIVIQSGWVEKAKGVRTTGKAVKRIIVCDPSRFGDDEMPIDVMEEDSAGVASIPDTEIVHHKTTMDTAGRLLAKMREHEANLIVIDAIGIGAGIADRLVELNAPVHQIVSSRKPTSTRHADRYFNLRAQMWFEGAKKIFEKRVQVPDDDVRCGQLASIHYEYVSNGRFKIESKDDIKARHGGSPDRGDNLIMGLHGLDVAERLDAEEQDNANIDRVGRGEKVGTDRNEYEHCYYEY